MLKYLISSKKSLEVPGNISNLAPKALRDFDSSWVRAAKDICAFLTDGSIKDNIRTYSIAALTMVKPSRLRSDGAQQ